MKSAMMLAKARKYGNKKCQYDGHKFDSILEMERYKFLKLLEKAGEIQNLKVHDKMDVTALSNFKTLKVSLSEISKTNERVKLFSYTPDFSYIVSKSNSSTNNEMVLEDCKGMSVKKDGTIKTNKTQVYNLKKKIIEKLYGMRIKEVYKYNDDIFH